MVSTLRVLILVLGVVSLAAPVFAQEVANWPAPATWTPEARPVSGDPGRTFSARSVATTQTTYPALPFIAVTPCRIADTRGNGFTGQYGPPSLFANATRSFTISGQCGIPASAAAVSFNFAALNVGGTGDLRVFPAGGGVPLVSTLNYNANTPNIANAAIVPLGVGGAITVQADTVSIDLIIDTNGYYGNPTTDSSNLFLGPSAGNATMTGLGNVGIGLDTLVSNTSGSGNSALGYFALQANQNGTSNTAVGASALASNVNNHNTGVGASALFANSNGGDNVAIGYGALAGIASSTDNIAIGSGAAASLTSGAHNIHIGNPALSSESNTIRIGAGGTHARFFVAGVRGVTTGAANAVPVVIDSGSQLGTINSSARGKREISDVGEESSAILKLRPVSFLYRSDTIGIRQYGLIAEEVAAVMPDLVQLSEAGEPEMVRYHFLPPLLLKELQKHQKTIERQNEVIAGLEARLARLEASLSAERGR